MAAVHKQQSVGSWMSPPLGLFLIIHDLLMSDAELACTWTTVDLLIRSHHPQQGTASPICDNNTDFKVSWGCTWSSPSTNQTDCFMCKKKLTCSPGYRRTDRVEGLLTSTLWGPEFFYSFRLTLNFHFYHASLVKTALMYCTYLASFIISFTAFSEVPTLLMNRYASVSLISTINLFFLNHS